MSKHCFEQWAHKHNVPRVKAYHADNVPFNKGRFKEDVELQRQEIDLSGVGAHNQNGVAERAIQTVTAWARTILLHQVLHWPKASHLELWPFAVEHAVFLWNNLPRKDTKLSPLEIFSQVKVDCYNASRMGMSNLCP